VRARLLACASIGCGIAIFAPATYGAIWGYVDEQGGTHVAREKLDERYQLFYRGDSNLDAENTVKPPDTAELDELRNSEFYQRVSNSPNFRRFEPLIRQHAKSQNLDPALVKAVITVESAFDPEALSPKGALGLMQVIPETAARYGLTDDRKQTTVQKLLDPATNLRIGTRYLHDLLVLFANDVSLTLAAYNAGEQAVLRYNNQIPPYPETRDYVKVVRQLYALYQPPPPPSPPKPSRITIPHRKTMPQ
jgi:soluble lytic murein transglycosylase-like protein